MGRAQNGGRYIVGIKRRSALVGLREETPRVKMAEDGTRKEIWVSDSNDYQPRANGGPTSITDSPDGAQTREWQDGAWRHRTDGPAMMSVAADGSTVEEWDLSGCVHRDGAPARTAHGADGSFSEAWMDMGAPYRKGGPAITRVSADGTTLEVWYETRKGKHRYDGGPAEIALAADGTRTQMYYEVGVLHRKGGPALLVSAADGTILKSEHFLAGEPQDDADVNELSSSV